MSHVSVVKCHLRDLDALETAAEKLGGVLHRNQRTFKMYGSRPEPCLHAITLRDEPNAYEIGLRQTAANDPHTFEFACDFFDGKLSKAFGQNLTGLQNEYLAVVAERQLEQGGYRVVREEAEQGIRLRAYA